MSDLEPLEWDQDLITTLAGSFWLVCICAPIYTQCSEWIMELLCSDYYKKNAHYKDINWAYVKLEIATLLHK